MAPTCLMLLWHQHQPFYKDLANNSYTMPWVRLHALKDYYGMVAILREFPNVHVTFNLVPSLVAQLEDYINDTAREEAYDLAFRPVESFDAEARKRLLYYAFQVNRENLLYRYPRFRELYEKARPWEVASALAPLFTPEDILDLQVLSQLAWFDEIYLAGDAELKALAGKQRGYTEDDKAILRAKELTLLNAVLEEHRAAAERGQIEISTSPFYHAILPLVCDVRVGAESHPGLRLPQRHFEHPEDARAQLRAAIELHSRTFGHRPYGLWPSEGSVSDEVLRIASEEGFRWAATDEGVLGRTIGIDFHRHADRTVAGGYELYRPHRFQAGNGREISLFFRDHQLSDLIGFVYSRMDPRAAAGDLVDRIRAAGSSTGERPAVVSIILDGENAWEFYPGNGREFLKNFYGMLSVDPSLRAVTASEALDVTERGILPHIVPGSWINANFDVWIGADEDNRAWDLLAEAHDFFTENCGRPGIAPAQIELVRQELWVAEGSDWNWWYGPEHSTANDEEFDLLYRKHLSNIYRMLGALPPDELALPIKRPRTEAVNVAPCGKIDPRIDGIVTGYFEWLGAGVYSPASRSGSMHGLVGALDSLHYGYSDEALCLRLDFNKVFLQEYPSFGVRVHVDGDRRARLHALVQNGQVSSVEFWRREEKLPLSEIGQDLQIAFLRIFEARLDYRLLGISCEEELRVQVSLWANQLPFQVIPQHGWLTLEITRELLSW